MVNLATANHGGFFLSFIFMPLLQAGADPNPYRMRARRAFIPMDPDAVALFVAAGLLACALCTSGCRKAYPGNSAQSSFIFVNASLHWPQVEIYAGEKLLFQNLGFPDSTGYIRRQGPALQLDVVSSAGPDTLYNVLSSASTGKAYSIFVVDSGITGAKATIYTDSLPVAKPGFVLLRFLNFSTSLPNLDLYASSSSQYLFTDRYYDQSDVSASSFVYFPAGTYNLQLRTTGTFVSVAALNGLVLSDGKAYTLFSRGTVGGSGNAALSIGMIENN